MSAAGSVEFAIALPAGWQSIDLLAADAPIEVSFARALGLAARGGEHARLLMLRSLVAPGEANEPLGAGLSVLYADRSAPVSSAPLEPGEFGDCEVTAVVLAAGPGVRLRRVAPAVVVAQAEPVPVLRVEYLIEAAQGLLTITFTTPQAQRTEEWEQLFDAMARTAELTA